MIKVFYRISSYLSVNPNPLGNDKNIILEKCLDSFLKAGQSDTTFIVDSLSEEWITKLKKLGNVLLSDSGNVETFHKQLDEVCKLPNEEKVLLLEDDYLWRPDTLKDLENGLDKLDLISPYDHPGHYREERFIDTPKIIKEVNGVVYREAPSNTLTFACKAWVIKQNLALIKSFEVRDSEMFQALPIRMFVPIYSFSTHMVTGLLSPNIQWV